MLVLLRIIVVADTKFRTSHARAQLLPPAALGHNQELQDVPRESATFAPRGCPPRPKFSRRSTRERYFCPGWKSRCATLIGRKHLEVPETRKTIILLHRRGRHSREVLRESAISAQFRLRGVRNTTRRAVSSRMRALAQNTLGERGSSAAAR